MIPSVEPSRLNHTAASSLAARLDPLRPPALLGRDVVGRMTRGQRALPGLLLAGGQRCGTTSLYQALTQQPQFFRPVWRKGVHYFDMAYEQGTDWYRSHFPLKSTVRRASERHATLSTCFESSPYYLFHPRAAERIRETLPEVRVVVLVRDPVERAVSAHAHELARGFETLTLAEALDAEPGRLTGETERMLADPSYQSHAHRHQAYRSRGEYAPQLERLAGVLGRDRIKVIDSHRFFTEPEEVFDDLLDWLGTRRLVETRFERHNARPHADLDPGLRRDLTTHFEPYDAQLAPWLGRPVSWRGDQGG